METYYPCPSCGFKIFSDLPGTYEICDICNWEDDHVQLRHPGMRGGANRKSLLESQREIL
ncbi:MAG: CPCC family cysteine-rich protein, partial [Burkholderiaceae bacterium]